MSRANLARAENVPPAEIDELLAQPDFQELLAALTELRDLDPAARLRRLEEMAWCVLEMAVGTGDWRAAAFVADQMRRGRHPARSLAQAVLDAQARALAANPSKPVRPRRARPHDPVDAALGRAASGLRAILGLEEALTNLPEPKPAAAAVTEPATEASAVAKPAAKPRRPNSLTSRLRASTAAPPATTDTEPRQLLRTWAQGP
jgi:hypothetical protein